MRLKFITPYSGDWLVIVDEDNGKEIYSGHGSGDEMYEVLSYLGIKFTNEELPDKEYEEKYA